jgi:outer membrane protein assembly factor BamB
MTIVPGPARPGTNGPAAAGPVVIDLGEVRSGPDEAPGGPRGPGGWFAGLRAGWAAGGFRRYRPAVLAVAAVMAASLGASAPAVDPLVEARVPMALGENMQVLGDRLYVFSPQRNQPVTGERRVRAYRLPDGGPLWEARISGLDGDFGALTTIGTTLLLARYDENGAGEMVAVDTGTGAALWRRPGWPFGWTRDSTSDSAGRLLLGSGGAVPGSSGQLELVTAVDPRTGAQVWTYQVPPGASVRTSWIDLIGGGVTRHLITGLPSGRVEVRDPATGVLLAAAETGPPVVAEEELSPGEPPNWLNIIEDLVLIQERDRRTVTAYGVPALDRRWSSTAEPGQFDWFAGPACGAGLFCVQGADGEMRAVDRATGRVHWSGTWSYVAPVGGSMLASRAVGPYGGETPLWLVDPGTGEALAELGPWAIAGGAFEAGDPIVVKQDLLSRRAWFGRVDEAARDVRLIGVVGGVAGECYVAAGCLLCRRADLSVGIWRYR